MELTQNQRSYVIWQAYYGTKTVQEILEEEFPTADLTFIRSYDKCEQIPCTLGAFLSEDEAELALAGLSSNGVCNLLISYSERKERIIKPSLEKKINGSPYIIKTTVENLAGGRIVDKYTGTKLDERDGKVAYLLLESTLCE